MQIVQPEGQGQPLGLMQVSWKKRTDLPADVRPHLRAGEQTQLDEHVKTFAAKFTSTGLDLAGDIMDELVKYQRVPYSMDDMYDHYSKRTASQIIQSRQIVISRPLANEIEGPVQGCVDYSLVLCATLRAHGIPAKFTRLNDHSMTQFYHEGEWYEANPNLLIGTRSSEPKASRGIDAIRNVGAEYEKYLADSIESGEYGEGRDAWDLGIRSYHDYDRLNP